MIQGSTLLTKEKKEKEVITLKSYLKTVAELG